ncbi:pentatricopeptide repeat-containing protein At2g29760, chloroplastic-like [Selaginella moellendorffii]|uniref:pentatricopeptide repeat-containing protein At2g29760, chloroplastic-like n=1 Tax=Selaginella moellendorffii TaxID=88036 RepID=UPI000D1CD505|nr:pentatricopeptide repeat-containing protein At2g29760, chloroplastic-like [Selaginella moellendorffii]|eukprot:XP_024538370.1 pentatricopeptide repeat-containing protein At2g29760, chloroplastic-like [Selaginella moellendorffii]
MALSRARTARRLSCRAAGFKVWRQHRCRVWLQDFAAMDLVAALKACGSLGDLDSGREAHRAALENGDLSSIFVATALIDMYSKCRAMVEARGVFDAMDSRDVVSWNALIAGYVENGQSKLALDLFFGLERPNSRSFVAAAMACVDLAADEAGQRIGDEGRVVKLKFLEETMAVHSRARQMKLDAAIFVGNALVNSYAKCGSLMDARRVFDGMVLHDVVSWNSLMRGCVENDEFAIALELFSLALFRDARTVVAALMALWKAQGYLRREHSGGCLCQVQQHDRFEEENGEDELALELFEAMRVAKLIQPDARTFVAASMACAGLSASEQSCELDGKMVKTLCTEKGTRIHLQARDCGFDSELFVANALIDMYAKCGSINDARKVFTGLKHPDVVSWTSLLQGYAEDGGGGELALEVFQRLEQTSGCVLNSRAFVAALMACSSLAAKEQGRKVDGKLVKLNSLAKSLEIHSAAARNLCDSDIFVSNALVSLYSNCGFMLGSRTVFDRMKAHDCVSWNSLILGYVQNGESSLALDLFECGNFQKNSRAFVAALAACAALAAREDAEFVAGKLVKLKSLERGMAIHSSARNCDWWESNSGNTFLTNSLFHMYSKCGSLEDAQRIFDLDRGQGLGTLTWKELVQAYVENGESDLALGIFAHVVKLECDTGALLAGLMACGNLVNLETGKWIQGEIYRRGYEKVTDVVTGMVSFYSKCGGRMGNARHVFDQAWTLDSVLWNSLICGYSREGEIKVMLDLLYHMRGEGYHPDGVTFLSILSACCHAGLVDRAEHVFRVVMCQECGIVPSVQHYTCMVDLFGRANQLDKALRLVEEMPHKPDKVTWLSLLSASRTWKNAGVGKVAFEKVMTFDKEEAAAYSLMANLMGGE